MGALQTKDTEILRERRRDSTQGIKQRPVYCYEKKCARFGDASSGFRKKYLSNK